MCECRDECYVVPKKRFATRGWWFGQIVFVYPQAKFLRIFVVRSQFAVSSKDGFLDCTAEDVDAFDDPSEAFLEFKRRSHLPIDFPA